MTDNSSPEKSPWGWKALIIACILGAFFMGFFYLAVSNEPDYMPSQQQKNTQQHAFKNAPAMSEEALAEAKNQKEAAATVTAQDPQMSAEEHAAMTEAEKSVQHGH
ncbi:hypothetical protein AY606_14810 [Acinetobacter sp. SFB]|uniref:hypothetical protein n=1 Tax=Acinetobacter sp. SFB TaxID=1805634 RepID=UPI0007D75FA2|nr:hypothetical protein [Acinetobacter sp. SFB]OAL80864.1 hypothetical protein AY606_14810 [Acinetobacter sp. SFB]